MEEIKKYPPTEEQITKLEADYFYKTVEANNTFLQGFEENERNRDQKSVEFALEKAGYEMTKEITELAQKDFEAGKITAHEACYLTITYGQGLNPDEPFPVYGENFL